MQFTLLGADDPYALIEIKVGYTVATPDLLGKEYANVFHFRRTASVPGIPDKTAMIGAAMTIGDVSCIGGYYDQNLPADSSISLTGEIRFPLDPTDPIVVTTAGPLTRGRSGDTLPGFSAATVQLKTGLRGKSFRGSKHFGPVAEIDTDRDELTATASNGTNWGNMGKLLAGLNDGGGNSYGPVVLSRKNSVLIGSVADTVAVVADITEGQINLKLGTMTRRKEK